MDSEMFRAAESDFEDKMIPPPSAGKDVVIHVYWHVVSKDSTAFGGNIPNWQINKQINGLNRDFADTSIQFKLIRVSRTINEDWFNNVGPNTHQQMVMKNNYRRGSRSSLNIYSVGFKAGSGAGLMGYATYPYWYGGNPKDDGVVILFSTIPGGSSENYNLGKTLTHEVGHWAGLFHTFQNGCSSPGDLVSDTPPEASPAYGCPASRDSCMGGGLDPIHNFMDFTEDGCMQSFTVGQVKRMQAQMRTYRRVDV
ncbi:hypothetical protein JAAARDRAFT_147939 [Jaapia argillacea MUCL 33604]|uniref:Peptidase M43 pregnancy-associated plasma-A domain-containing protein n=1 Tax=Jaapia argillacea MUCL 33604 TaxID=933084 RepID=A0A067QJ44_9AGAM|nr:hypothetical protein JAAARDRAFT_147939 [Jaapia argillacea MUCL 33604]